MPRYVKSRPIILYSNLVDIPDIDDVAIRGIPDESVLQEVSVVVLRPGGDRYATLTPKLQSIDGFGDWYTAILNLKFSDEVGEWTIKWIYRTTTNDIEQQYKIDIVESNMIPMWCFQSNPIMDDTLPDDIQELLVDRNKS